MISPIQMFDVSPIQTGMQMGMQRGSVNSPFTALGTALKSTVDKYDSTMAAQREHAYKMSQIRETGRMDKPWLFDSAGNYKAPGENGATGFEPVVKTTKVALDEKFPDEVTPFTYSVWTNPSTGLPDHSTPVAATVDYKKIYTNKMYKDMSEEEKNAQEEAAARARADAAVNSLINFIRQ